MDTSAAESNRCPTRTPGKSGSETAATRRLRTFLTAATTFDCELSETQFRNVLHSVAPPIRSDLPNDREQASVCSDPTGASNALASRRAEAGDRPPRTFDLRDAALSARRPST